jgi:N-acetyl-gamma-glutamyl-phosphate reductase
MNVAVLGGSGYAGGELLRLFAGMPEVTVSCVTGDSARGREVGEVHPALAGAYRGLTFTAVSESEKGHFDAIFLALPHGESQTIVPRLSATTIIDLGADYRLSSALYEEWYGTAHRDLEGLRRAVYGLVERHRDNLPGSTLIAAPGCYPTATTLAVAPFIDAGLIGGLVTVNALSGVSGAGRASHDRYHFPRIAGGAEAYGVTGHRHSAEMERELGVTVHFTPHLIPISRGMLVTASASWTRPVTTDDAMQCLVEAYRHDPCVVVRHEPPSAKDAVGSNTIHLSVAVNERTGQFTMMGSIDNLGKGAAGQAIQAWNVARGAPEIEGLALAGVHP